MLPMMGSFWGPVLDKAGLMSKMKCWIVARESFVEVDALPEMMN